MLPTAPSSPTCSSVRRSTARSWRRRDSPPLGQAGGLADIAHLPLTDKDELRATRTPDNPIGAHLCATPSEIVRIYSTSGTTGAPSYVPLTAGDLDNWVTASARSYAASGIAAGQRIVSTYNAAMFYLIGTLYPLVARATYPSLGFPQYPGEAATSDADDDIKAQAQKDAADALAAPLDACRTFFMDDKPFIGGASPSIADIRLAVTLEILLHAIDYEFPAWATEYMAAMDMRSARPTLSRRRRARLRRLRQAAECVNRWQTVAL